MSSVECLKELISERRAAAAEEIFRVFQKNIIKFEEEINRQHRLLDILLKELPQQHVCKLEEVLTDQQLCDQERNSSLDQDDPEPPQIKEELCSSLDQDDPDPPQIKEEEEELCTSLEGEQLVLKQETETFMLTSTCEESDNSEDQTLDLSPDETQSAAEKQHIVIVSVKGSVEPEPNRDDQLLSHSFHEAESQDHKGGKHGDSGSTRNAESRSQKRRHKSKNHTNNEDNSTTSNIHSKTHTGKQCIKCDTCGKAFKDKPQLQTHLRVHTGEKPYTCITCEKRFSKLDTLKKHLRTHTGEKPYTCNTCEKRFSQLGNLKEHMRVHTGEKPYHCKTCGRDFRCRYQLKDHMRTHTGEKPYHCKTCGRDFRCRYQLKDHMRTHAVGKDSPRCQT